MDYDNGDDWRPRFQIQASSPSSSPPPPLDRIHLASCFSIAICFLTIAFFSPSLPQFFLLWIAFSLLLAPFAPASVTGGDCRVGLGQCLPDDAQNEALDADITKKLSSRQQRKTRNGENPEKMQYPLSFLPAKTILPDSQNSGILSNDVSEQDCTEKIGTVDPDGFKDEADWTSKEIDLLRKQLTKHPRGKLRRWELIAEAFNGSRSVESVVTMSKALGEKKGRDDDSFSKFLAQRKGSVNVIPSPLSQRWDFDGTTVDNDAVTEQQGIKAIDNSLGADAHKMEEDVKPRRDWTEIEDKALLTAFKSFPKDTPMRWDKIAVAVPGKTKAQCFRRFAELRENFRNKKVDKSNSELDFD